jgi:hemoglobin-like flavoprotein
MQALDKPYSISFHVTNIDQLKKVREFIHEVGFQHIREGANPFEIFEKIETEMLIALVTVLTVGSEDITVDFNLFE